MARRNDRRDDRRDESGLDSHTLNIYRTAATVKGGRRFSFGALVVVGDRRGRVGYGYAKAKDVPGAIEKANKKAKQNVVKVSLEGTTIPHEVMGRNLTSKVKMIPASPGTGVVAGTTVRAVLEMAGVTDCLTKCFGSTTSMNVVKAVFQGLGQIRQAETIAELRGVELEKTETAEKIEAGSRFMVAKPVKKAQGGSESKSESESKGEGESKVEGEKSEGGVAVAEQEPPAADSKTD